MGKPQTKTNAKGVAAFQASIRIKGAEPIFRTFATLDAATEFQRATERRIKKELRDSIDPRSWLPESGLLADQRLREVLEKFKESLPVGAWHGPTVTAALINCGDPTIGQLFPSWIKKFILRARQTQTMQGRPYAWSSIRHQLSVISVAIKWRAEELDISPPGFVVSERAFEHACKAEGLRKEALVGERDRRFEPGEEERLMSVIRRLRSDNPRRDHWPLLVEFALATGARLSEMSLAEWKEIDASMEWWDIPGEHSKTKSRTMLLNDEAYDVLVKLKAISDPSNPRIFHTLGDPGSVSDAFAKYSRRAKLDDFRFHDLRHEGISRFVLSQPDMPVRWIMKMVGHSSLKMLDRYAKLRPHEMRHFMRRRGNDQLSADKLPPMCVEETERPLPDTSTHGVNRFADDFLAIRSQPPVAKPAAPIYGAAPALRLDVNPASEEPPGRLA